MDKPPTNKWKVTVGSEAPKSFRSENKAYVFGGRWGWFEVFEERPPDDTAGSAERRMADN